MGEERRIGLTEIQFINNYPNNDSQLTEVIQSHLITT